MICLSLLVLLSSVANLQYALAEPTAAEPTAADPLVEFCGKASAYLVSDMRSRGDATSRELGALWESTMNKAASSLQKWNETNGYILIEGLPGDHKSAMKKVNKWFGEAGDKFVEAQKSFGAHLQKSPVRPSDISAWGSKLNSRANNWFQRVDAKMRQLRKDSCAVVLAQEAELKRIHSEVEGLTVALERIPSGRLECLAVATNQRLAEKCRGGHEQN